MLTLMKLIKWVRKDVILLRESKTEETLKFHHLEVTEYPFNLKTKNEDEGNDLMVELIKLTMSFVYGQPLSKKS